MVYEAPVPIRWRALNPSVLKRAQRLRGASLGGCPKNLLRDLSVSVVDCFS